MALELISARRSSTKHAHESQASRVLEKVTFYFFAALMMFGPLAFGAVEEWSIAILEIGATVLLVLWAARQLANENASVSIAPIFYPCLLMGAVIAAQLALKVPAYSYAAHAKAWQYVAYGAVMFVGVQIFKREDRTRHFFYAMAAFGFAIALFGIIQNATSPEMLYWVRKPRFSGFVYGPYVNHNHFAGLMEMLTPIAVVLALSERFSSEKRAMFGFAALIMAASIVLSQSRSGMIALALEMVFLGAVIMVVRQRRSSMNVLALIVVAVLLFTAWYGADAIFARFHASSVQQDSTMRIQILKDSVPMVAQRPVLGWGLGNFPVVYPKFRTFFTNYYVNEAHNDYMQFLVECGVAGFVALLGFLFVLFWGSLSRVRGWQDELQPSLRLAALTGCVGLLVHSLTDFNLQIPGNALMFYVLAAASTLPVRERSQKSTD